jgi:Zn-dependent peptidase ImmA (M78 family)
MKIINNGNYFTNTQLNNVINKLNKSYMPTKLIICENKSDMLKLFYNANIAIGMLINFNIFMLLGQREGIYYPYFDIVVIFVFSENDDGNNKHSKQLYSLHALLHELRHRYQCANNKETLENDCDNFATNFINNKSKLITNIMGWSREWTIEEED